MRLQIALLCLVLAVDLAMARRSRKPKNELFNQEAAAVATNKTGAARQGKLFSLFNIVQFDNDGCRSTARTSGASSGSNHRNGTCYTSQECANRGGTASGSCAAGFGVCCVFIISKTGNSVNNNCTYIQNPNFPNTYSETSTISYTINKCSSEVCSIRLDFESFTIVGTVDTEEIVATQACDDTFTVTGATGAMVPTICGRNTGQHMYIDIGRNPSDSVSIAMSFSGTSNARSWDIKVTQIKCTDELLPPEGCLQYHVSTSGRLETFNFMSSDETHLPKQDYNICIRQEQGMCCVQYQACPDTNSMTLALKANAIIDVAGTDTECTFDYIYIEDSGFDCEPDIHQTSSHNRYCGKIFAPSVAGKVETHQRVCDCTQPFMVGIHTDELSENGDTTTANTAISRGTCLTFNQLPC